MSVTDYEAAYLRPYEEEAAWLEHRYIEEPEPDAFQRALNAHRLLERRRLELFGIDCPVPECHLGEVPVGWRHATHLSPPEPIFAECPCCKGEGIVLPDVARRWMETHDES